MIFAGKFSRNFGSSLKNTDLRYCLTKLLDKISNSRRFLAKVDRDLENRKIQSNSREMRPVLPRGLLI